MGTFWRFLLEDRHYKAPEDEYAHLFTQGRDWIVKPRIKKIAHGFSSPYTQERDAAKKLLASEQYKRNSLP